MKSLLLALSVAVASAGLVLSPIDAQAKRLGGGKPAGMQRQMPANPPPANTPPAQSANPGQSAAAPAAAPTAAATPGKRSWMGPLAGLAAGIGLAALFSHLGMGEAMGNIVMFALLALVAVMVGRWLFSRFGGGVVANRGPALAGAGAGAGGFNAAQPAWNPAPANNTTPLQRNALASVPAAAAPVAATLPGGVAHDDFVRLAKMVFVRLQAANDAGNVDDLRKFTTPELFASLRVDLQERGATKNVTDVVKLDAEVADVARQDGQDIVSVRFHGLIREAAEAGAEPFNELWHLVKPQDGSGDWAIAGITPLN